MIQPLRYWPLGENAIRIVSFVPDKDPDLDGIHLVMNHFDKYMGHDDAETGGKARLAIENTPLSSVVEYIAISYCWGDPASTRSIIVNGQHIDITLSLWETLKSILKYHNLSKYYWIDALCLDQSNVQERNHQVHQMWRIYSGAEQVFACIGPCDTGAEKAYAALSTAMKNCQGAGQCCCYQSSHILDAQDVIEELLDREYFKRTWIKAEFIQARTLQILCGPLRLSALAFEHANSILVDAFKFTFDGGYLLELRSVQNNRFPNWWDDDTRQSWEGVLHTLLTEFFIHSRCSQPRDRIFALLGHPEIRFLSERKRLQPDYSLTLDELAMVVLEWSDCLLLAYMCRDEVDDRFRHKLHQYIFQALELPYTPAEGFCAWMQLHSEWDLSDMPRSLGLEKGRRVNCTGKMLGWLFSGWNR